jgi:hypothetical protein
MVRRGHEPRSNWKGRCTVGDKGKKDKDKGQKQKTGQKTQEAKKKQDQQPKRKA